MCRHFENILGEKLAREVKLERVIIVENPDLGKKNKKKLNMLREGKAKSWTRK